MATKGQGLPLNLIVLAIIAALVLVLVIAFTVGGGGAAFSRIFKVGSTAVGEDIDSVRAVCRNACSNAELSVQSAPQWPSAEYCKKGFNIDRNGDGKIEDTVAGGATTKERSIRCWDEPVSVSCQFSTTGTTSLLVKSPDTILTKVDKSKCDTEDVTAS